MMTILKRLKKSTSGKIKKRSKAKIIRSVWFNKQTEPEKHTVNSSCFLLHGEMKRQT